MTKTPMQQCVQSAVLALLGMGEAPDVGAVAARCPHANEFDIGRAVQILIRDGFIEGPTGSVDWLARVAEGGFLTLSGTERQRVAEDT